MSVKKSGSHTALLFQGGWLALTGLLWSCSARSSTSTDVREAASAERRAKSAAIARELLESHGMETIWFNEPKDDKVDRGVHAVDLLGDGLFIASKAKEAAKGHLKMVLRANGNTRWYFEIDEPLRLGPSIYQYPQGVSGKPNEVYFSQLDTVYCVDLRYGDLLWKHEVEFPISTRVVADDLGYFVGSDNGRAYGLRKSSKVDDWTYRTVNSVKASLLVDGPNVYVASTDGIVYRLAGRTGWVHGASWKVPTGARIVADPVAFSRWVIVGSTDYKLYCLESIDGSTFWTFPAEAPIEDVPVVYSYRPNQDFVYCIAVDRTARGEKRTLFSVKLGTGEEAWRTQGVRKVVAMGKNHLYVLSDPTAGDERCIVALDILTGKEKFRIPSGGFHFIPTNLADSRNPKERGRIYLIAEDGTIQVIGERL